MSVSIAELGERALRRLGVAIVPIADRPTLSVMAEPAAIATAALIELGVIASDETPSAADQALAMAKLAQVQASLASQAVVWWCDDQIPVAVAEEYTRLTGLALASSFGRQADAQAVQMYEGRVRRMAGIQSSFDQAAQAVQAVHDHLVSTGVARWSVYDIPTAAEYPYELLAANRLADLFERQFDPNDEVLATRALAQIVALETSGERVYAEYF